MRLRVDYEYEFDFWAREAWVLAVVDTVVAVVSLQQKYLTWHSYAITHAHRVYIEKLVLVVVVVVGSEGPYYYL